MLVLLSKYIQNLTTFHFLLYVNSYLHHLLYRLLLCPLNWSLAPTIASFCSVHSSCWRNPFKTKSDCVSLVFWLLRIKFQIIPIVYKAFHNLALFTSPILPSLLMPLQPHCSFNPIFWHCLYVILTSSPFCQFLYQSVQQFKTVSVISHELIWSRLSNEKIIARLRKRSSLLLSLISYSYSYI